MIVYNAKSNLKISRRSFATLQTTPEVSPLNDIVFPNTYSDLKLKKKDFVIYVNMKDLVNVDNFAKTLSCCTIGGRYSILVRVCYVQESKSNITEWKTLGNQISFSFNSDSEFNNMTDILHNNILQRLDLSEEIYNFQHGSIATIQFLIYGLEYSKKAVKKEDFNSLGEHKDLISVSKNRNLFNSIIPYTMDKKEFGIKLNRYIVGGNILGAYKSDHSPLNLIDSINKHENKIQIQHFASNTDFYMGVKGHIISVNTDYEKGKLVNRIDVYDISGIKIVNIEDVAINNSSFMRKISGVTLYIGKNGVYNKEIDMGLDHIKLPKLNNATRNSSYPDIKTGCFDLETYYDDKTRTSRIYAAGFCVGDTTETFYINKQLDHSRVLTECLDAMLVEKYQGYTFYVHNLGGFDSIFILHGLIKSNENISDKYKFNTIIRDDKTLFLEISTKRNNKKYTIKLVDSYNILSSSLDKLCKTFNPSVTKGYFPYTFVNSKTLFYVGNKPGIEYYEGLDLNTFNNIENYNWSMEQETTKYLIRDLESLQAVMDEFKTRIFMDYYVHVTNSLTISGLAMQIFLKKFYKNNIPLINKKSLYNDIKSSYYGGVTEVYKPYGKDLYYYDVNSLYPYAALNSMPGTNCKFIENINCNMNEYSTEMFGFYYCKIKTSKNYIGLLPVRCDMGIIMPLGYIEGWYFSEELKFAHENGYEIDIISGYTFDREEGVFNEYVKEIYKIKSTSNDDITTSIAKSLLNNLLGRFGLSLDSTTTEVMDESKFKELLQYTKVHSIKYIGDKMLVTYDKDISKEICDNNNVDYHKTFVNHSTLGDSKFKKEPFRNVSIAISSAVTSYSRIFMNRVKLDILNRGGSIYYTDTDSIVTDIKLPESTVGSGLGQFKLVCEVMEGYFISNKTYCIRTKDGKVIIKNKGVNDPSLSFDDFIKLYKGVDVETFRNESIKDYSQGSVIIKFKRDIKIHADAYKKRSKIYINNMWEDTKPLNITNTPTRGYHTTIIKDDILNNSPEVKYFMLLILSCILYGLSFCLCEDIGESDSSELDSKSNDFTSTNTLTPLEVSDVNLDVTQTPRNYSTILDIISNKVKEFFNMFASTKQPISYTNDNKILMGPSSIFDVDNKFCTQDQNTNKYLYNETQAYINTLESEIDKKNIIISTYMLKDLKDRIDTLNTYYALKEIHKEFNNILNIPKSPKL